MPAARRDSIVGDVWKCALERHHRIAGITLPNDRKSSILE
jgi:hypothetical protein